MCHIQEVTHTQYASFSELFQDQFALFVVEKKFIYLSDSHFVGYDQQKRLYTCSPSTYNITVISTKQVDMLQKLLSML